jgi:hypothetical protein
MSPWHAAGERCDIGIDDREALLEVSVTVAVRIMNVRLRRPRPDAEQTERMRTVTTTLSHCGKLTRLKHKYQVIPIYQGGLQAYGAVPGEIDSAKVRVVGSRGIGRSAVRCFKTEGSRANTEHPRTLGGIGAPADIPLANEHQPTDRAPFDII